MKTEVTLYKEGNINLEGYVAYPEQDSSPLILIAPTWAGKDDFVHDRAHELASLGFTAFAVDMYGDGKVGSDALENEALMTPLIQDRNLLKRRIIAALTHGKTLPGIDVDRIAAIGYCFGGLVVLDLARAGESLKGVVSFHGLLMGSDISSGGIKAKVLALHGERDPMVPLEMVDDFQKEMTSATADWQLHSYGGTFHAFTNPEANDPDLGTQYNDFANKRSWKSMQNFFEEIFS